MRPSETEQLTKSSQFEIPPEGGTTNLFQQPARGASRVEVQTREGKVYAVKIVIAEDPDLDLIELLVERFDQIDYPTRVVA